MMKILKLLHMEGGFLYQGQKKGEDEDGAREKISREDPHPHGLMFRIIYYL